MCSLRICMRIMILSFLKLSFNIPKLEPVSLHDFELVLHS